MNMHEAANLTASHSDRMVMSNYITENMRAHGRYDVQWLDANGNILLEETVDNLLTTQGRNHILDTELAGSAYTAAWYCSLYTAGTAGATGTYAAPIVTEITSGALAARVAVTFASASAGSKASNTINCTFVGDATVTGLMMLKGSATIGDTATSGGILLSAALLTNSRVVHNNDQLNITYTLSV